MQNRPKAPPHSTLFANCDSSSCACARSFLEFAFANCSRFLNIPKVKVEYLVNRPVVTREIGDETALDSRRDPLMTLSLLQ